MEKPTVVQENTRYTRILPDSEQEEKMTDAEMDRILSEALGDIEKTEETRPQTPLPVPEKDETLKEMIKMQLRAVSQLFAQQPDAIRQQIKAMMNISTQNIVSLSQLTGRSTDQETIFHVMNKDKLSKKAEGSFSMDEVSALVEAKILKKLSDEDLMELMTKSTQGSSPFSQEESELNSADTLLFKVVGIEQKYHAQLATQEDIMIEFQLALFAVLFQHEEFLDTFVEFSMLDGNFEGMLNGSFGSSVELTERSLQDLCSPEQFQQIGVTMTKYLVDHYQLES